MQKRSFLMLFFLNVKSCRYMFLKFPIINTLSNTKIKKSHNTERFKINNAFFN